MTTKLSSSSPVTQTLSYAQKAAQNIRSPVEQTVHTVSVSLSTSTSSSSPFSSNASNTSSTAISSNSTDVDSAAEAPTTSNSSVILESDGEYNGEQEEKIQGKEDVNRTTPARKPAVNVWQIRMAEARQQQQQPGVKKNTASSTPIPTEKPHSKNNEEDDTFVVKVRPPPNNWLSSPSRPATLTRPTPSDKPTPLDLRDSSAWPEVSSSVSSPSKAKGKGKSSIEEEPGVKENEHPNSSPSKSIRAKPKSRWVAIPAEELQAAVDAATVPRRQQAKNNSNPKTPSIASFNSPNKLQSRDSSSSRPTTDQNSGSAPRNTSSSKPGSRSGSVSRIQSCTGSAHASPVVREVSLLPEETMSANPCHPISATSNETSVPPSTFLIPSAPSPLPSVFPVQIQQQHQQQRLQQQYLNSSGAASYESHVLQPTYLPNGHFSSPSDLNPIIDSSSSTHISPADPSSPRSPLSSQSPVNVLSNLPMPYPSPYPFYSTSTTAPYEYAPPHHTQMTHHQMYWSGPSPSGSGHQTPNYVPGIHAQPFVMPPVEYGILPYGTSLPPQYYSSESQIQHSFCQQLPLESSLPSQVEMMRPKVVFGSFDGEVGMGSTESMSRSFSVGLGPDEAGPSSSSKLSAKTRKSKRTKRTTWKRDAGVMMLNHATSEIVDLTEGAAKNGKDRRWMFGRFGDETNGSDEREEQSRYDNNQGPPPFTPHLGQPTPPHPSLPPAFIPVGAVPIPVPVPAPVPPIPLSSLASLSPINTHFPHPIPPHPSLSSHLGPFSAATETGPATSPSVMMNGVMDTTPEGDDGSLGEAGVDFDRSMEGSEWEVRDFGYGFGREGKVASSSRVSSKDPPQTQVQPQASSASPIEPQSNGYYGNGRPRRGSYSYNNPYAGYGDRAGGWDRGTGYGDRSAYGERGYIPRRGRGYGGRGSRGFRRGGVYGSYGYERDRDSRNDFTPSPRGPRVGGYAPPSPHHHQPPFEITPPPQFQPLPVAPVENGLHTYIPLSNGYEYQTAPPEMDLDPHHSPRIAPLPPPITRLPMALDPTVYYLLGQLEYYLSPQNMAQDFFLRQKMDSHGWVPIPLIASFNRVRQLTTDENFVREVLNMSSVVEVKEDMVRMKEGEWKRFVLPDAHTSHIDSIHDFATTPPWDPTGKVRSFVEEAVMRNVSASNDAGGVDTEEETDIDEEEEEDVVFVMG